MTALRRIAALTAPAALLLAVGQAGCARTVKLSKDDSPTVLARQLLDAPNPSLPGPFPVKTLYYGSGDDKQRVRFRDSVAFRTKPVDASPFVTVQPAQVKDRR